ncbi:MAG: nuclear transport factor 2 family protein [Pseudomonadota bacterium]
MQQSITEAVGVPNRAHTMIHDYFAAIRARDRAAWCATFESDGELVDPADAAPRRGHDALATFFEGFAALFAVLDFVPHEIQVCGGSAAVCWKAHCVARNGAEARVSGIDVFEFAPGGRIRRVTGWWNPAPLLAAAQA